MRLIIPLPAKTVEVSFGHFSCPGCERTTLYKHKQRVQRQLVYIIPFLGAVIAEYIECQTCRQRFALGALRTGLSDDVRLIIDSLEQKLNAGVSIEKLEEDLLASGTDLAATKRYVSVAAGILFKRCPRCNLRFIDDVQKCNKCGHVLPSSAA